MEAGDQEGELSLAPSTLTQCPLMAQISPTSTQSPPRLLCGPGLPGDLPPGVQGSFTVRVFMWHRILVVPVRAQAWLGPPASPSQ